MEPVLINQTDLSPEEVKSLLSMGFEVEQGSEEWFEDRLGKVTASKVRCVVNRNKYGKPYEDYYSYMRQLVLERVLEKSVRFSNRYMEHGKNNESDAADKYEAETGREVLETGFHNHPKLAAGASPDRLVDADGILEIKAPNTDTVFKYLLSMIDKESPDYELVKLAGLKGDEWEYYYPQIQMQLWITKRKWCDFVIYDPDLPEDLQLQIKRVKRNAGYIKLMEHEIKIFLTKVAKLENWLRQQGVA